jgi:K+-dependent Na+/Ca+ exchanger-like protein
MGLSPDVAGATFMAAGSSAPELASSFMGTFISKSDVGLGTIIGSAVFNILIIIGATALVVGETMQLDWKPLSRDCTFYMGSVVLLIAFVAPDNLIETWDAAVLLVYYFLYILFMFFNTRVMRWVARKTGEKEEKKPKSRRPSFSSGVWATHTKESQMAEEEEAASPSANSSASVMPAPAAASGYATTTEGGPGTGTGRGRAIDRKGSQYELPLTPVEAFSNDLWTQDDAGDSSAGFSTGTGTGAEPGVELPTMGADVSAEVPVAKEEAKAEEKGDVENGKEEKEEEEEEEEEALWEKVCNVCGIPYVYAFMLTMPDCKYEEPSDEDADEQIEELQKELTEADAGRKTEIEAEITSLEKQKDLRAKIEEAEEDEDDKKVKELQTELFVLYEPLTCGQRWYLLTFFVSLIWITILSYFMVVLMEKIGCIWGISSFIMGITFLAAGTSIPDALGSIAVAKEGEGDMAVSNAIGSNVFDICLGLGFPWFIATLIDGEGRPIRAAVENIAASVAILFGVVGCLWAALGLQKHPETGKRFIINPKVGYILFAAYFLFIIFQFVWTGAGLPE